MWVLLIPLVLAFTWNIEAPAQMEKFEINYLHLYIYPTEVDEKVDISCEIYGGELNGVKRFNFNRIINEFQDINLEIWANDNIKIVCKSKDLTLIKEIKVVNPAVKLEDFPLILKSGEENDVNVVLANFNPDNYFNDVWIKIGDKTFNCQKTTCKIKLDLLDIGYKDVKIYVKSEGKTYLFKKSCIFVPGGIVGLTILSGFVLLIVVYILFKMGVF
jgi:hypothetical protein